MFQAYPTRMNARKAIADNISTLISDQKDRRGALSSLQAIEDATARMGHKVGRSTIDRISKGTTPAEVDNLEALAKVFGIELWQLFVPGLVPGSAPELRGSRAQDNLSDEALEIAVQLDSITDHELREVAVAKAYTAAFRLQRPSGALVKPTQADAAAPPPTSGRRPVRP